MLAPLARPVYSSVTMKVVVLSIVALLIWEAHSLDGPKIQIEQGQLLGTWLRTHSGRQVASFRGIPYARPPVGSRRFKPPQQPKQWTGVWDATNFGEQCLQVDHSFGSNGIVGNENCLFVNVFSPNVDENAKLPVVVFIHGGAFMFGSGDFYLPTFFLEKDVVLVTLNYRLNVFGFLSTEDSVVSGNMGLKDQSAALHWVKKNIQKFGGNSDSITITGLSAGGASVHYQYLSRLSKGTFNRGISFSGSSLNPWTLIPNPLDKARALAAHIGCLIDTTENIVECLRQRPAASIIEATKIFDAWKVNLFSPFAPVVETNPSSHAFLTKHPYKALLEGDFTQVPWITSVTSEEGLYPAAEFSSKELLEDLNEHWESLASYVFVYNDTLPVTRHASVAEKIKTEYLHGKPISRDTFPQLVQALGDRHFVVGVQQNALMQAQTSKSPVYFYRFSYRTHGSLSDVMSKTKENFGVSHGDDVFQIYDTPFLDIAGDKGSLDMSALLTEFMYTFARDGVPKMGNILLEPVDDPEILKYTEVASLNNIVNKKTKDLCHTSFWKSLGFKENENLLLPSKEEL